MSAAVTLSPNGRMGGIFDGAEIKSALGKLGSAAGGLASPQRPHRLKQKSAARMGGTLDNAEAKSALGELGSTTGGLQTVLT